MSRIILFIVLNILVFTASAQRIPAKKTGVAVRFENFVNEKKLVLSDSFYTNLFGEQYRISKLRYYVSNLRFITEDNTVQVQNIFLVDASKENTVMLPRPKGKPAGIEFLLGVDSLLNCSGAQSGALDPLNDMFWTWNNGYVMFKLDGSSEQSTADNQRIEMHIGGYTGPYKTMRTVRLMFAKDRHPESVVIQLDLDKFWHSATDIRIAETPVITTIGEAAKKAADNFPEMFSVKINN